MESSKTKSAVRCKMTTRKSWLALYAALLSTIVFADRAAGGLPMPSVDVSPVAIDAEAPAFEVRSIVRRFDI